LDKTRTESKSCVLSEEKLDEIGARLEQSPKSLRFLAQETRVSSFQSALFPRRNFDA
jgi:hypothetical protein